MSSATEGVATGIDVGSSLVKVAQRDVAGSLHLELFSVADEDAVHARLRARRGPVGLTGAGSRALAEKLEAPTAAFSEFEAWAAGSRHLLKRAHPEVDAERYLVTSLGTGTSYLCVDAHEVRRVGGTALGGGTLAGLGATLVGTSDFPKLVALAQEGSREPVDLLLRDIDPHGLLPLPPELSASFFAKLARPDHEATPADLAHGLMNVVGFEIGMTSAALASAEGLSVVIFGGSALHCNPVLTAALAGAALSLGKRPVALSDGAFTGALGALLLAADGAPG